MRITDRDWKVVKFFSCVRVCFQAWTVILTYVDLSLAVDSSMIFVRRWVAPDGHWTGPIHDPGSMPHLHAEETKRSITNRRTGGNSPEFNISKLLFSVRYTI